MGKKIFPLFLVLSLFFVACDNSHMAIYTTGGPYSAWTGPALQDNEYRVVSITDSDFNSLDLNSGSFTFNYWDENDLYSHLLPLGFSHTQASETASIIKRTRHAMMVIRKGTLVYALVK